MLEKVVVNNSIPHFMPKFENPMYLQAQKQALRKEALFRIRTGNFESLFPLVENIYLTSRELDSIFKCWQIEGRRIFLILYSWALKNHDLEKIQEADCILQKMREKEESRLR